MVVNHEYLDQIPPLAQFTVGVLCLPVILLRAALAVFPLPLFNSRYHSKSFARVERFSADRGRVQLLFQLIQASRIVDGGRHREIFSAGDLPQDAAQDLARPCFR